MFAPITCIIPTDRDAAAPTIANDTPFGLTAGSMTRILARAPHLRVNMRAGCVMGNRPDPHWPCSGGRMNRVGMVIDMRHSGEGSTMSALEHSSRPITVTHANPATWHPAQRTKSDPVIGALAGTGAVLGLSLCPHHLNGGSICQVKDFYTMIARTADWFGRQFPVIGADLVQDQPDTVVEWMRTGRWAQSVDDGEGSKAPPRLSGHARLIPRKDRTQGGHLDRGWS